MGIPTIRDRVVQMAVLLILEPIFEADLAPEQHAYRPDHSAHDALRQIRALVDQGHVEVVDADLSGYFDSIPHAELMKSVARRVSDGALLRLVKQWLVAPVEEIDERGHTRKTTRNKDTRRGTPQGAPLSPLLANLYMRRFVLGWKTLGHERSLRAKNVNYADDFVICCRRGCGAKALAAMREMMERLKLTVNEAKTHLCRLPDGTFDFLGYTFGRLWSRRNGHPYLGHRPSKKSQQRIRDRIHAETGRNWLWQSEEEVVAKLNRMLVGWHNYFSVGTAAAAVIRFQQPQLPPQQPGECQCPRGQRDEYEIARNDIQRCVNDFGKTVCARGIHSEWEDSAPVDDVVRQRNSAHDVAPYTEHHQQRYPPCGGRPDQQQQR